MGNAKHYWQKVLHTIDQFAMPQTRRLARELSAVVEKNQSLTVELESVRNEFESARNQDRSLVAEFGQRITELETEHDTAQQQLHDFKTLLTEASIHQESTTTQVRRLEREQSAVVDKNQLLTVELESVRNEFESARNQDRSLAAEFGQRITGLETERDTAQQQLHDLKTLLTEASTHQESTATQVRRLESKLEEEYSKHESLLETMHATLMQVQNKQQTLLEFQSDLDDSVRKTKQHLLEVIRTESVKPHNHVYAMVLVAALFLLNTITGAASIWIFRQDLLEFSAVTNELKLSIKEHISQHELALTENPAQTDAQGPGDVSNIVLLDSSSNLDESDDDYPNTLQGDAEAGQPDYESANGGPPLLLQSAEDQGYDSSTVFDPLVKELQTNLMALGFDLGQKGADGFKGALTEQALREFQILYQAVFGLQQGVDSDDLAAHVSYFADLAREDERKYKIDSAVLAAIRLSNLRTGVDFSFLMELAAAESAFDTGSKAAKSSATGLYQFKQDTWLETVKRHGEKYGIGSYASQVDYFVDSDGNSRPMISDSGVYKHVLSLRRNPRMAALLAAEHLKDNMRQLSLSLHQQLGRTEMYLTHFLGASGAITFLELLGKNPDKVAGDIFPGPASRNTNIFHKKNKKPRTVAEVYNVLGKKFSTSRYKDWRKN